MRVSDEDLNGWLACDVHKNDLLELEDLALDLQDARRELAESKAEVERQKKSRVIHNHVTSGSNEITRLQAANGELVGALNELLECADLRGDADLPHPCDDPKLWTSRMIIAWEEARAALASAKGEG